VGIGRRGFPWLALVVGVGGYVFDRGRDKGFVLYISLFLPVLGWWVGVCLYTVYVYAVHLSIYMLGCEF